MKTRLKKADAMARWEGLPTNAKLRPRAISNKHTGSTYGHDGVRIEGSPEFIDAVLGRLKDLLACENAGTRIGLNYTPVEARPGKPHSGGEFVCYVKVYERGDEAKAVNAFIEAARARKAA